MLLRLDMQIDPVAVFEKHQIEVGWEVLHSFRVVVILVGFLIDEQFSESMDPGSVLDERCSVCDYIDDVIILEDVRGDGGVRPGSVLVNDMDTFILFGSVYDESSLFPSLVRIYHLLYTSAFLTTIYGDYLSINYYIQTQKKHLKLIRCLVI